LDQFVEQTLIPEYTRGKRRAANLEHERLGHRSRCCRKSGRVEEAKALEAARRTVPSCDTRDPNYRRLRYVRYADDFLLGFAGPKSEAEAIRDRLSAFLAQELGLELSAEKTLITHASTEKARFLGYDISVVQCDTKITGNRRSVNGGIALRMPPSFVAERSRSYTRDGRCCTKAEGGRTGRSLPVESGDHTATRSARGIPWWVMMFIARHRTPASVACRAGVRLATPSPKIAFIRNIAVSASERSW
jgi:Reverse transcriptase (RNA-dependent DNA polymerase)